MSSDLESFAKEVHVRPLTLGDFDHLVKLQSVCFPGMKPWQRDHLESQLATFAEGQICVEIDGQLVASSSSLILDYDDHSDWHDWASISDGGYIRNHDLKGDTLYGIEIMVHPDSRGLRLARRLYEQRKELCRKFNLSRMVIGGRIPGYGQHKNQMSAQEYVRRVINKELFDTVLTTQLANGFVLIQLIPDYMPSDEDSAGYATCLEWPNLDFVPKPTRRSRRAVELVRVSVVQYPMKPVASWEEFERQCDFFVDVAGDNRADFLLFPELFTLQLLSLVTGTRPGQAARALAEMTPRYLELFTHLAVKYNVNIIGGSQFTVDETGRLENVSYLFRRNGTLDRQSKIHVTPNERRWWGVQGGDKFRVFDTDLGPVAVFVCYDIEFPELCRLAAAQGALIFFVPSNTADRYGYLRVRICSQARAIENQVYVALSGCVGSLPQVENADIHYSQSAIFTPSDIPFARDGIAVESSPNLEAVLTYDLDLELLRRARRGGTVRNWDDRRKELYQVHVTMSGETTKV